MLGFFVLGVGGAAGAIARYLLDGFVQTWTGPLFPFGTLTVNILGCLVLGCLATLAEERSWLTPLARTGLLIGFLGAFTTFSTFAYETWRLVRDSEYLLAGLNVFGSLGGCFAGLLMGVFLARTL